VGQQLGGREALREELDGEDLPRGWVLVLLQDGQPPQTVGRKV